MLTGGGGKINLHNKSGLFGSLRRELYVLLIFMYVFVIAAKVMIFFRNSRFLGGVFLGCAQESRCGRWRGVSFCRVCHPRCYWRRCTQRLYNAPACAHSPVIPASEPESIKRGLMRSCSRPRRGCPRRRRCTQRLYNAPAIASRMDAGSAAGMTAEKRRAENKGHCAAGAFFYAVARITTVSFPPPSGNPGQPYAGYCVVPCRCHPRQRLPRPRVGARGDGAVVPLYHRTLLHGRPFFSRCHSLARQLGCVMLGYCATANRRAIVILALAFQGPASSAA